MAPREHSVGAADGASTALQMAPHWRQSGSPEPHLNGAGDDAGSGASEHDPGTASEATPAARTNSHQRASMALQHPSMALQRPSMVLQRTINVTDARSDASGRAP